MADEANKRASADLEAERNKLGFPAMKAGAKQGEHSELEDDDAEDIEEEAKEEDAEGDETEEEEDDSEESEEDDSDEEEGDDDSEDDDEEDDSEEQDRTQKKNKRGVVPFKTHNKLRKELRDTQLLLQNAIENNKQLEAKLPDDFQERIKALAKEIGIDNPEGLTKIMGVVKDAMDKNTKNLEERLAKMEKDLGSKESNGPVDEFPKEWETFSSTIFENKFPNASQEQLKAAQKLMSDLAHDKKTGGKVYKDPATGKVYIDPYPLRHIFYDHEDKFRAIVTGKKVRGMETAKTNRFDTRSADAPKALGKHSTTKDIKAMEREYARIESGASDSLRAPNDDTI